MNRRSRSFAGFAVALAWLAAPSSGRAQGFLDVYAGAAFTQSDDLTTRIGGFSFHDSVDFDPSAEIGIRGGLWFPELPWLGIASDLSYFRLDGPSSGVNHRVGGTVIRTRADVDAEVFPISILLMLRTKVFTGPFGDRFGVQPYAGVGPGFFVSWAHDALTLGVDGQEESVDDVSYRIGLDTRAGLRFHLTRSFALFAEYRFTYHDPQFEDKLFGDSIDIESEIATHHAIGGVGFQF